MDKVQIYFNISTKSEYITKICLDYCTFCVVYSTVYQNLVQYSTGQDRRVEDSTVQYRIVQYSIEGRPGKGDSSGRGLTRERGLLTDPV